MSILKTNNELMLHLSLILKRKEILSIEYKLKIDKQ